MKNWQKTAPPYEGSEPYLYFAFAEADSARAWKILRTLLERGCRVWYCCGPAGSAEELRHRQERADNAALTLVYLTDAACSDRDTKTFVLVNQKYGRPILCLEPDGADRRLAMGLHDAVEEIPLYRLKVTAEIEDAIVHAEGFSQDIVGTPVKIGGGDIIKRLTLFFCALALLLGLGSFAGYRYLNWFQAAAGEEVQFTDPVLRAAVRKAVGGPITQERLSGVYSLRLEELPSSWDELSLLPALEQIEIPQQVLLGNEALPDGAYVIVLIGGGGK